ncbi:MAG TPA: hypothetical protein VHX64_07385 [Caulobacteraceae bacterium]|nr:hypothetical protein [Caulobacteraceae bacterium]
MAKLSPPQRATCVILRGGQGRDNGGTTMRSVLLLLIGVPLPIILLLAMCTQHF